MMCRGPVPPSFSRREAGKGTSAPGVSLGHRASCGSWRPGPGGIRHKQSTTIPASSHPPSATPGHFPTTLGEKEQEGRGSHPGDRSRSARLGVPALCPNTCLHAMLTARTPRKPLTLCPSPLCPCGPGAPAWELWPQTAADGDCRSAACPEGHADSAKAPSYGHGAFCVGNGARPCVAHRGLDTRPAFGEQVSNYRLC